MVVMRCQWLWLFEVRITKQGVRFYACDISDSSPCIVDGYRVIDNIQFPSLCDDNDIVCFPSGSNETVEMSGQTEWTYHPTLTNCRLQVVFFFFFFSGEVTGHWTHNFIDRKGIPVGPTPTLRCF